MNKFTLVRKNLLRQPMKFLLLYVVILVAFLLFGMLESVQGFLSSGGGAAKQSDRLMVSNLTSFTQPLPFAYVERVAAIEGVKDVSYMAWFGGYYKEPGNALISFAVEPDSYLRLYPELQLSPEQRASFVRERSGVIVGQQVAEQFGWKLGQRVTLSSSIYFSTTGSRNWEFLVTGIYANAKKGGNESSVYFHYDYFNDTRTSGKDKVGTIIVLAKDAGQNDKIAAAIDAKFANSGDETATVSETQFFKAFLAQFGNIGMIVSIVVGAAFCSMLLVVGNTLMMTWRARTREIAVLKALGFPSSHIVQLVVGESVLLSMAGGASGLALAWGVVGAMKQNSSFASLTMSSSVWIAGLGIAFGLGAITAASPVWRALRVNVIDGLGKV
ncbi:ABC transporter permease [Massilia sp. P8910]|uniref:ABC transporter permease n=1 Tax=Massilia antarctica TaxID=2765360 RepID=UPI001E655D9A|nr:ABC transporter permease [Massilia antarctica]MCE3602548.1 ABC transporter permease [Massilia antarctica]